MSLALSHFIGPVSELGQLGPRGRRIYNLNESKYGAGGRFIDWWIFGGCVWLRASLFIWDWVCSAVRQEEGDEGGEQNVEKEDNEKHRMYHVGIVGYDSSLGAHGPVVLAPIRASVFILVWCTLCTFLTRSHDEMSYWLVHFDDESIGFLSSSIKQYIVTAAIHFLNETQYVLNAGPHTMKDIPFISDSSNGIIMCTIVYTIAFTTLLETSLIIFGMFLNLTGLYVPKGVSDPGGPRPHKIMRIPKWKEGQSHVIPKELLANDNGKWRCAVAHDSHRDTIAQFKNAKTKKASMSGEPFGRQTWTLLGKQPRVENSETEDDLNVTLSEKIQCKTPTKKQVKNRQENVSTDEKPNLFQQIGDFLANTPPKLTGKETKQKNLIQLLASGGRPPLAFDPSKNVNSCDQIFRAQMISSYLQENGGKFPEEIASMQTGASKKQTKTVMEAARQGVAFYSMLQTSDGHWAGDYGGPHFLMPGLIVAWYVMGKPKLMISPAQQALMLHYLRVHQQEDGGWGTHIESPSTMFGTVICYLAVRLLGAKKDEEWIVKGREFILKEGGAVMTSSWAKFWLCLIGCMDWKGPSLLQ